MQITEAHLLLVQAVTTIQADIMTQTATKIQAAMLMQSSHNDVSKHM